MRDYAPSYDAACARRDSAQRLFAGCSALPLARDPPGGTAMIVRPKVSPPIARRLAKECMTFLAGLEEIALALERFIPKILPPASGGLDGAQSLRSTAMPKPESFPIAKIYVPVKRKKALKPELVQEIAESILEIGQQAPIVVRPDEDRFILVEGLHRFEACKALGEKTIIGFLVSAEIAHQKTLLPHNAEAEAERDKMARLKKLRLEKETAEKLTLASKPAMETESAELLRKYPEKGIRNNLKATPSQLNRMTSASKSLSEWLTQQKRDGGRY